VWPARERAVFHAEDDSVAIHLDFSGSLRAALIQRRRAPRPRIAWLVTGVTAATLAYILLSIAAAPSGAPPEYHFANERGAIGALSAIYLSMAAAFALATLAASRSGADAYAWPWLVIGLGLGFLALDELMQLHEHFGAVLGKSVSSGVLRNWNDGIVILYGIIALPVLLFLLPALLRSPRVVELLAVAFACYALHTLIDSTQEPSTTLSNILEESAKLFCGAFLALGSFTGLLNVLARRDLTEERRAVL